jgi:predicted nucleic acid-binding protein
VKQGNETVVIDTSAVVCVLTDHGTAGKAARDRLRAVAGLAAPGLLDYEVVSALLGMTRGAKITQREAEKALTDFQALALTRHETLILWQRVRALHHNISPYDAQYVALAETLGVPLLTCDARIKRSGAARCAVEVFASMSEA